MAEADLDVVIRSSLESGKGKPWRFTPEEEVRAGSTGRVVPDSFTHGSAEQRKRWFMTGYKTGSVQACDTFKSNDL